MSKTISLFSRSYGEISAKPLLILHGVFGSGDNWITPAKKLADRFHVFTLDQRNHGRSPWAEPHSYEAMAEDVAAFIREHNFVVKPHILGHSMGGKTAMVLAQLFPELIDQLIVADIGPKRYTVHHQSILDALNAIDLAKLESRGQADEQLLDAIPEKGVRQFLLKNLYRNDHKNWRWRMNLPLLSEHIATVGKAVDNIEVHTPSLFLRGELSHYINDEDWDDIRRQFIFSSLETVPRAGHWLHADQPTFFLEKVNTFLMAQS